jgi:pyruvate formate lyase activating enzyme
MKQNGPLIFDIRRFALDDGPGIRSTVFFKGCPLSCVWCHNPESIAMEREATYYPAKCINCLECRTVCPERAITLDPLNRIDRVRCVACGACAELCPALAIKVIGGHIPVDDLVTLLLRDRHFYDTSGGGVTFSGGEPTLHFGYLREALMGLKRVDIQTAIQTCGLFDFDRFVDGLLPFIDLVYYDIKLMDPVLHRRYTGISNELILRNFIRLSTTAKEKITPRVPLVPGITATSMNIHRIASFLSDLGYDSAELLSYNPSGIEKRLLLGGEAPAGLATAPMTMGEEMTCRRMFLSKAKSGLQP